MTTKLVLRVLSTDGRLLGWTETMARARGDGCLRADGTISVFIEADGVPDCLSIHWADLHTETRVPLKGMARRIGDVMPLFGFNDVMVRVGATPGPLPPVTVRSVAVGIPAGRMGARG